MVETGFCERLSNRVFFTLIAILFVSLLGFAAFAVLLGGFLTLVGGLLTALYLSINYFVYPRIRNKWGRVGFNLVFVIPIVVITSYSGLRFSSQPSYAILVVLLATAFLVLAGVEAILLYERFITPRLKES